MPHSAQPGFRPSESLVSLGNGWKEERRRRVSLVWAAFKEGRDCVARKKTHTVALTHLLLSFPPTLLSPFLVGLGWSLSSGRLQRGDRNDISLNYDDGRTDEKEARRRKGEQQSKRIKKEGEEEGWEGSPFRALPL